MNKSSNRCKNHLFRVYSANVAYNRQGEIVHAILRAFEVWVWLVLLGFCGFIKGAIVLLWISKCFDMVGRLVIIPQGVAQHKTRSAINQQFTQ